jgi:hypothetical protein
MILTRLLARERACDTQDCRIGWPWQGLCERSGHLGQCDAGCSSAMVPNVGAQPLWGDRALRERKFSGTLSQSGVSGLMSSRFGSIFLHN